jgi:hypothetical protein
MTLQQRNCKVTWPEVIRLFAALPLGKGMLSSRAKLQLLDDPSYSTSIYTNQVFSQASLEQVYTLIPCASLS